MGEHVDPYRRYLHYPNAADGAAKALSNSDLLEFYSVDENKIVCEEVTRMLGAFQTEVYYGQRHYAACPAWRDELAVQTTGGEFALPRFAIRVHLFERCDGEAGRYLGFVSLRPPKCIQLNPNERVTSFRYIIDAELTTPKHMQRPRYHVLNTTAASARLGVVPFRSSVYSCPGPNGDRGSTCVHLAVSQALHLIMGRFACRPISQIEFDWHLWKATEDPKTPNCSIGEMGRRGASPTDALAVVRDCCNGGGYLINVEPRESEQLSPQDRNRVVRYLTDSLANGLPVVAMVSTSYFLPRDKRLEMQQKMQGNPNGDTKTRLFAPHCVLVLGMHILHSEQEAWPSYGLANWTQPPPAHGNEEHNVQENPEQREDHAEMPGRVIIHDSLTKGPFYECLISDFLKAAEAAYSGDESPNGGESSGVHLLALGPRELSLGVHAVRESAEKTLKVVLLKLKQPEPQPDPILDTLKAYMQFCNLTHENATTSPNQWRLVCRFMGKTELETRYSGMTPFMNDTPNSTPRYVWAVEVRHPRAQRMRSESDFMGPSELAPALVFVWDSSKLPEDREDKSVAPIPLRILHSNLSLPCPVSQT